jgi:orotidine-5'-phosphate decarboxylase
MKNPVIVALDVDSEKEASQLVAKVSPYVGGFKVGPRLTLRADKSFLKDLSQSGILFFDHKFFDIPSTTVASVKIAAELGAHWVTVHALNGPECLRDLSSLENEIRKTKRDFRVLAVTVLTSFSTQSLPPIWKDESIESSVVALAQSAHSSGVKSFVCSPEEVSKLHSLYNDGFFVVPGIRPTGSSAGDQKRTAAPSETIRAGASALVIGRPIIAAKDPAAAAREILESLQ